MKGSGMNYNRRGNFLPSRLGKAYIVKNHEGYICNCVGADPSCGTCTRRRETEKATGGHTKVSKGTRGHKGKLHLFERSPARWAGRVALQPHLEAFLMVTFNKVRLSFVWKGSICSRMATFLSQNPHLLFLELHQTNTAIVHRRPHQTEF